MLATYGWEGCSAGTCQSLLSSSLIPCLHRVLQRTRPDEDEHSGWAFAAPGDAPFSSPTGHGSFGCDGCIPDTGGSSGEGLRGGAAVGLSSRHSGTHLFAMHRSR